MNPAGRPLARLLVVTDRRMADAAGHRIPDVVAAAVAAGARTVLLREKDLPPAERAALAGCLAELLAPVGGHLLVAVPPPAAPGAIVGVHVAGGATEVVWPEGRRPDVVGRSCHSADDVRRAADQGYDYVTVSPVWATPSKPGYGPALGPEGLAVACAAAPELPVYALGGIGPGRAGPCRAAGAAGVAVMGAIMRAEDPGAVVDELTAELGET